MGKRKSKRKPQAKKKLTLDIVFDCMFCNHERVVEVKMEREHNIGSLRCRICNETFQTPIHALSEPIDVYSDWLDSCEAANVGSKNRSTGAERRVGELSEPEDEEEY